MNSKRLAVFAASAVGGRGEGLVEGGERPVDHLYITEKVMGQ